MMSLTTPQSDIAARQLIRCGRRTDPINRPRVSRCHMMPYEQCAKARRLTTITHTERHLEWFCDVLSGSVERMAPSLADTAAAAASNRPGSRRCCCGCDALAVGVCLLPSPLASVCISFCHFAPADAKKKPVGQGVSNEAGFELRRCLNRPSRFRGVSRIGWASKRREGSQLSICEASCALIHAATAPLSEMPTCFGSVSALCISEETRSQLLGRHPWRLGYFALF